jgi:ABC-type multidrug transport system permease subunit
MTRDAFILFCFLGFWIGGTVIGIYSHGAHWMNQFNLATLHLDLFVVLLDVVNVCAMPLLQILSILVFLIDSSYMAIEE